jgi:hypothetical protein
MSPWQRFALPYVAGKRPQWLTPMIATARRSTLWKPLSPLILGCRGVVCHRKPGSHATSDRGAVVKTAREHIEATERLLAIHGSLRFPYLKEIPGLLHTLMHAVLAVVLCYDGSLHSPEVNPFPTHAQIVLFPLSSSSSSDEDPSPS